MKSQSARICVQILPADPFWVQVREAVFQQADRVGAEVITMSANLLSMPAEAQVAWVEELFALEPDALIVGTIPRYLAEHILDRGLRLIYSDESDIRHPHFVCPQGLYDAAYMAGRFLGNQLAEETVARGRVLILGGHVGSGETGVSRISGFRAGLTSATDAELIHVPAPWAYDEVSAFLQDAWPIAALAAAPPFDALFGLSDSIALAGHDFGRRVGFVGDKTRIVGFNGDPLAISSIVQGTMLATVETSPADLGIQLMDHAWQAAHGQPLPPHFRYKLRLVTAENAAAVAAEKLMSIATLPTRLVNVNRRQEQLRMVQLETSLEINHRAGSVLAGTELSRELANLIRAKFRYDDVQLFHWHDAEKSLVLERSDGAEPIVIPLAGSGALEQAIVRNQPIFIPDAHHSQRFAPDPYWPQTRTRVVLPIRLGGRLLGMLDLHSRTHKDHSLAELEGLQSLADQLGVALHNAQLYQGAVAAREEAELASQLKTRLLSNVSHEFRMPLNVILGYVQAALEMPNPYGVELPAPLVRDLEHVLQSGHHLVHLVNDLLDVSQAEIGALELYVEELDVIPFLTNTFAGVANTATNRGAVEWRLQLPHTLPPLVADPVRMRQILFNLLDNARKFTARGHVTMGATADHANLHLWVEDTGCGFPPALLADLRRGDFSAPFSPDVRTGLGLGLTVVQYLVALHAGRMHVISEQGRGTVIHLYLPLCGPETGTNASVLVASPAVDQDGAPGATPGTDGFLDTGLAHSLMRADDLTLRVAEYLQTHYHLPLTRQAVADAVGVSPSYVTRVFRRETGLSPWQYLNRYRIAKAQRLLASTNLSVTEVADLVGYSDSAYFSRIFRKETGQTPLAYRNGR